MSAAAREQYEVAGLHIDQLATGQFHHRVTGQHYMKRRFTVGKALVVHRERAGHQAAQIRASTNVGKIDKAAKSVH